MIKNLKSLFSNANDLDQKSANVIIQSLDRNNLEGFDYLEFKQSLTGLENLSMDETTRYQSAFVTAQTMGLTKVKLLETAKHYINILQKEKAQFDKAVQQKITQDVSSKKGEIDSLEKTIKLKFDQIKKLKEEIEQHQAKIAKNQEALNGIHSKIEQTKTSFENAHQVILDNIQNDISKIENYIQS